MSVECLSSLQEQVRRWKLREENLPPKRKPAKQKKSGTGRRRSLVNQKKLGTGRRRSLVNQGAVLLTVGWSNVGNDITHSTLLDRACACSYENLPKYRSYRVSNSE